MAACGSPTPKITALCGSIQKRAASKRRRMACAGHTGFLWIAMARCTWATRSPTAFSRLSQQLANHRPVRNRRTLEASVVEVRHAFVIQSQQMQNRGVNIVDVAGPFHGAQADLVGGSHSLAAL